MLFLLIFLICCIILIWKLLPRKEQTVETVITIKRRGRPRKFKQDEVTIEDMVLHDITNENNEFDIGQINL